MCAAAVTGTGVLRCENKVLLWEAVLYIIHAFQHVAEMTWLCQKADKVCQYVKKKGKLGNTRKGNENKTKNVIRPIHESIVFLEHY